MKISGNNLGILNISALRRKRSGGRRPPWYIEVPPDTVDIALLPRINRYERGPLKFHVFGSTQQKIAERLALFREAMDELPPGLAHSEDEMREGLEMVMRERLRIQEEQAVRAAGRFSSLPLSDQSGPTEQVSGDDDQGADQEAVTPPQMGVEALEDALMEDSSGESKHVSEDDDDSFVGTPTQWLIDRLNAQT